MAAIRNPVDDKARGALKRYGARAATWGLLTVLYAVGRDHEAQLLRTELDWGERSDDVLKKALALPDLGRAGEGLVGWAAHRYHVAERFGDTNELRRLEDLLPRAAYSVLEWSRLARPRPNLFDLRVDEAYEKAKAFLGIQETQGPRQGPVVFRFDDGWTIQDLNSKALLVDEGNRQHICVGQEKHGYPLRVEAGLIKIYSLRDRNGKPHVTMTWSAERKLYEAATEHNGEIKSEDIRKRCAMFGRSLGMEDFDLVRLQLLAARDADLRGVDLSGASLQRLNLSGANLSGANLSGADASHVNLEGANLAAADLERAYLPGAILERANMSHVNLGGANLSYAKLRAANMKGARMSNPTYNTTIHSADAREVDLSEVDLSGGVNLTNSDFSGANFSGANLNGAFLDAALLINTNLRGANLRGAQMHFTRMHNADLRDADLRDADLHGAQLFHEPKLSNAKYNSATLWPAGCNPARHGAVFSED